MEEARADGRLLVAPDTSAQAIMERLGHEPATFDELAWQEDLRKASKSARRIGEETRSRLEWEGQVVVTLFACDENARTARASPAA